MNLTVNDIERLGIKEVVLNDSGQIIALKGRFHKRSTIPLMNWAGLGIEYMGG